MSRDLFRRFPAWMAPILFGLAALAIFLVVLARDDARSGSRSPAPAVRSSPQATALRPGMPAPDFTATAFDGSQLQLSKMRGHVVLINFFASWCAECRTEFPDLQAAYIANHAAGFDVVGVNALETGDGEAFYREFKAGFPAFLDPLRPGQKPGVVARAYGVVDSLPVSVLVDRGGLVRQYYPGRIDRATINDELRRLGLGA